MAVDHLHPFLRFSLNFHGHLHIPDLERDALDVELISKREVQNICM